MKSKNLAKWSEIELDVSDNFVCRHRRYKRHRCHWWCECLCVIWLIGMHVACASQKWFILLIENQCWSRCKRLWSSNDRWSGEALRSYYATNRKYFHNSAQSFILFLFFHMRNIRNVNMTFPHAIQRCDMSMTILLIHTRLLHNLTMAPFIVFHQFFSNDIIVICNWPLSNVCASDCCTSSIWPHVVSAELTTIN